MKASGGALMKVLGRLSLLSCLALLLGVGPARAETAGNDAGKPPAPKKSGASTFSRPTPPSSNVVSGNRGTGITISGAGGNDISVTQPTDVASGKTSNLIQGNPIGTDKSGTGAALRQDSGPRRGTAPGTSSRSGAAPLIVPAIQKIRESSARTQTQNQPTPAPPN